MKIKIYSLSIAAAALLWSCGSIKSDITSNEVKEHIEYLASDAMKGRKPGTEEGRLASKYIADNFRKSGIKPLGDDYFQKFEVITSVAEGKNNSFSFGENIYNLGKDYRPLAFTYNKKVSAKVVFAGYGIEFASDSLAWNDFSNIDVNGKWVLVLRQDPDVNNSNSPLIDFSTERAKVLLASDKGAAGVLFVSGVETEKEDILDELYFDKSSSRANLPVIQITRALANKMLASSSISIEDLEARMIKERSSVNFELDLTLDANTDIEYLSTNTQNVIGFIEGSDEILKNEIVIIGAHYDHLGMGGPGSGSRAIDTIAVHNGADDNASGVAGILEIGQKIANSKQKPKRSVIVMGFAAEEMGLLGSKFFTENPLIDITKVKMMLNFDMIGRLDSEGNLTIGGTGTTPVSEDLIAKMAKDTGLKVAMNKEGSGPSDHSSFYVKNIPVLFFFTGIHDDYHTPADDADRINFEGEKTILDLGYNLTMEFANMPEAPKFVQVDVPSTNSGRRKLKVTFGIVPNFASGDVKGMKVDGVKPDGPAAKAGMQKGDVIIAINGLKVENIYDYMARLGRLKKGERCNVDVMREDKKVVLIIDL